MTDIIFEEQLGGVPFELEGTSEPEDVPLTTRARAPPSSQSRFQRGGGGQPTSVPTRKTLPPTPQEENGAIDETLRMLACPVKLRPPPAENLPPPADIVPPPAPPKKSEEEGDHFRPEEIKLPDDELSEEEYARLLREYSEREAPEAPEDQFFHEQPEDTPPPPPQFDPEEQARREEKECNDIITWLDMAKRNGYADVIGDEPYTLSQGVEKLRLRKQRVQTVQSMETGLSMSRRVLVWLVGMIETLNGTFRKGKGVFRLKGWSEDVYLSIGEYDHALMRIWERYGKVISEGNPLIELGLLLALSGASYHREQARLEREKEEAERMIDNPVVQRRIAEMVNRAVSDERNKWYEASRAQTQKPTPPSPIQTSVRATPARPRTPPPHLPQQPQATTATPVNLGGFVNSRASGFLSAPMPTLVPPPAAEPVPQPPPSATEINENDNDQLLIYNPGPGEEGEGEGAASIHFDEAQLLTSKAGKRRGKNAKKK